MSTDRWLLDAVAALDRRRAVSAREAQRYIDDKHHEELSLGVVEGGLELLVRQGRLRKEQGGYRTAAGTSRDDALRKLFGDS